MSKLINALNRIRAYLESNYPDVVGKLPPGLPLEEIEEIFRILPYGLPQEVYQLYHWCGGWTWETENWDTVFAPYYGTMTLCSPQGVIETVKVFEESEVKYIGKPLIPIFGYDRIYLCIVGNWQENYPSPIVYVSELNTVTVEYISLISMMQVSAELWETGAAHINKSGLVECDEKNFFAIYRQNNPSLPQIILARFNKELELAGSNSRKLYEAWNSFYDEIDGLTKCWLELSIYDFQAELIEPILREFNNKDKSSYSSYAKQILENLKYRF